uniref:Uncharacterized protein n=1 Tax=Salix viminalis TaxID=40686 RepID=A0A6N2LP96_SALVM
MSNLVRTEIDFVPEKGFELDCVKIGREVMFRPDTDTEILVHSYLISMAASLSLPGSCIANMTRNGLNPKAFMSSCWGQESGFLKSEFLEGGFLESEFLKVVSWKVNS